MREQSDRWFPEWVLGKPNPLRGIRFARCGYVCMGLNIQFEWVLGKPNPLRGIRFARLNMFEWVFLMTEPMNGSPTDL